MATTLAAVVAAFVGANPVERHVARWDAPPHHTPSTMVPDGPILANGDMGVGVGDAVNENMSYYFGKMDFWTSNAFDGRRYAWTHVAPGYVSLSFSALHGASVHWTATQELLEPRVNATLATATSGSITTSALFDPEANVFISRIVPDVDTDVTVRLSTQLPSGCDPHKSCMAELPMEFLVDGEETAPVLAMTREANHMVNNEATLVECDSALIPTMGARGFKVGPAGEVTVGADGTERCLALLPREGGHAPGCGQPVVVSQAECSDRSAEASGNAGGGGMTEWRLTGGRISNPGSGLCLAYSPTNVSMPVSPCPCTGEAAVAANLSLAWTADGTALRATAWLGADPIEGVPTKGVPRCLLSAHPNVNVSLGMAVAVTDASGVLLPGTTGTERFASHGTFSLTRGTEYVLAVSIETTRQSNVPAELGALPSAVGQVRSISVSAIADANRAWWAGWWAEGAEVDLGPNRQVLEAFWYGSQYILGSMSRPCKGVRTKMGRCRDGETVPGLLGPWSMMNPVGWCDRLTLDYNVEANYFGAASSNHLDAMLPYFPTMSSLLDSGRRRAAMPWGSPWYKDGYNAVDGFVSNGHPSYGTWNQDIEHVTCGPGNGLCPNGTGGYTGAQMPCAMGPWSNMVQWKDNSVRFEGALMAVPFVDYYEHTLNTTFLKTQAYPFLREMAEFYASYLRRDPSTDQYGVPLACAQEGCAYRQLGKSMAQEDTTIDLAFAEWSLRKAAAYAEVLGVAGPREAEYLTIASKLRSYPTTVDPNNGNRTCWSEAMETATQQSTPLHANYMYPIVQFAPLHPTNVVNLHSDSATLATARHTVWGQNQMSKWAPVNGLCLAWPAAAKVVDFWEPSSEFGATTLLNLLEGALNRTMQPNFWPSMDGGGVEQVGATQAVNDLLLQSVNRTLHFFPGWEPGPTVSFKKMRAPGAFVVSASLFNDTAPKPASAKALLRERKTTGADGAARTSGPRLDSVKATVLSEAGGDCIVAEFNDAAPLVTDAAGNSVNLNLLPGLPPRWTFHTSPNSHYTLVY